MSETKTDRGSSISLSMQEKRKQVVPEAKLKSLEELEFYLKLPFQRPVKMVSRPLNLPAVAEAMKIKIPPELKLGGML